MNTLNQLGSVGMPMYTIQKKNLLISPALNVSSFSSTASKSYNARTFLPSEGVLIAVEGYKVDPLGPPLDFD